MTSPVGPRTPTQQHALPTTQGIANTYKCSESITQQVWTHVHEPRDSSCAQTQAGAYRQTQYFLVSGTFASAFHQLRDAGGEGSKGRNDIPRLRLGVQQEGFIREVADGGDLTARATYKPCFSEI
jgi:hypothetical protein